MTKKSQDTLPAAGECPFRSAYSARLRVALTFPAQGRTKQSFKEECDINRIMSQYLKTGVVDFVNKHAPQYYDVTGVEYQDAMNIVAQSQTMFAELPAKLREQFENDPALFLDFVSDPENRPEMAVMGLLTPEATQALKTKKDALAASVEAPSPTPNPVENPVSTSASSLTSKIPGK